MSFKCRILGPVYSKGRHYVLHEGAIDPHDAKEALLGAGTLTCPRFQYQCLC